MNSILVATMPRNPALTDRQKDVLDLFQERSARGEPPPTYREIADHFGWSSATAAQGHVRALVRKGRLKVSPQGQARGTSLGSPIAYRTTLLSSLAKRGGLELSVPTYVLPEEGVLFAFHMPDGRLAKHGILERDLVFVGPVGAPAKPRFPVIAESGAPVAVAPGAASGRMVRGVVVAIMRSLCAEAMAE